MLFTVGINVSLLTNIHLKICILWPSSEKMVREFDCYAMRTIVEEDLIFISQLKFPGCIEV